jgi:hypothetical protein
MQYFRSQGFSRQHARSSHCVSGTLFQPGAALALSIGLQPISSVRIRVSQKLISVYRMHQPTLISPCLLGDPCSVCVLHALCHSGEPCKGCRKGRAYECERAYPASPAFVLNVTSAVQLVKDGFARFIHRNSALQLTFAQLVYLRDQSCRVDEHVVWQIVRSRFTPDLMTRRTSLFLSSILKLSPMRRARSSISIPTNS